MWKCGGVWGERGKRQGGEWRRVMEGEVRGERVDVSEQFGSSHWPPPPSLFCPMALPTLLCEATSSCFNPFMSSCAVFKSSCNMEQRCSSFSDFSTAAFLAADSDSSLARISETEREGERRREREEGWEGEG